MDEIRMIDLRGSRVDAKIVLSAASTLGDSMGSPSATSYTASTIAAGGVSLSRKPLAARAP
jgi:hypothetical protein